MATKIYNTSKVVLFSGREIEMRSLKIKYLREFMEKFDDFGKVADDNTKSMDLLIDCVAIALKQYAPELAEDRETIEDEFDLPSCYKVVEAASGINLTGDAEGKPQTVEQSGKI